MTNLWNSLNLRSPSNLCTYLKDDLNSLGPTRDLIICLKKASDLLGPRNPLWSEEKVLNIVNRNIRATHRNDKFMKFLSRVECCLKKLRRMNMPQLLADLSVKFSSCRCTGDNNEVVYLPSRQELEYVLIRIQGTSKLLSTTQDYIQQSFRYLLLNLGVGHCLQKLLIECAIAARLNFLCRKEIFSMCILYQTLRPWCGKLKPGLWQWECDPEFPEDLQMWLNPKELEVPENINTLSQKSHMLLREYFGTEVANPHDMKNNFNSSEQPETINLEEPMDLGEVISREEIVKPDIQVFFDNTSPCENRESSCVETKCQKDTVVCIPEIKPVKSLKELRILVEHLGNNCSTEDPLLTAELKKKFRECKHGVKNLNLDGQENLRKKLICRTSKSMIAFCQNRKVTVISKGSEFTEDNTSINEIRESSFVETKCQKDTVACIPEIKPVKSLKELRILVEHLGNNCSTEDPLLTAELKKKFRECKHGVKNLNLDGQKGLREKLIRKTSKSMIAFSQNGKVTVISKGSEFTANNTSMNGIEVSLCTETEHQEDSPSCVQIFKPVKSLKKLKILVEHLSNNFSTKDPSWAKVLKQTLLECRRDFKCLNQNGKKALGKKLIYNASKSIIFLSQQKE